MNGIPRFDDINKITLENSLPDYCPEDSRQLGFEFIRVDQLPWGQQFKGLEFYNLQGFNISFADNDEHLCHMQMWAAGLGVDCGVHNHANDSFCEVHACIINGSGKGGMQYLNGSEEAPYPGNATDSAFEKLPVPSFYEHGPLWDVDAQNKPVFRSNGAVVYPWHKWQAGTNASFNQSYDIWTAFEFNPQLATLPV
jgi:hypothetical protein